MFHRRGSEDNGEVLPDSRLHSDSDSLRERWKDELVPDWFVDDGCSASPDFWWGICGRYHDWYYSPWSECPSRIEADREFARRLVRATGSFVVPMIYYLGVRLGGFWSWKRDNHGNASRVPPGWKGPEHLHLGCWD